MQGATMSKPDVPANPSWVRKFRCALRGVKLGVRGEVSFFVHFFATAAVIAAALVLQVSRLEWCILVGCISAVLTAEMANTALERLAKAVDQEPNPHLRDALDIGSGAVLLAAIGAVVIGAIVFLNRLVEIMSG
jgi:diacylglycerol kinase